MAEVAADTRCSQVVNHVKETLDAIASSPDDKTFEEVGVYDDLESFRRKADALTGTIAGLIVSNPERDRGMDSDQSAVERVEIRIAILARNIRDAGEDESKQVDSLNDLISIVRNAIVVDRTRGGLCEMIQFRGTLIRGTEIAGSARTENNAPNKAFNIATVPLVCGWAVTE